MRQKIVAGNWKMNVSLNDAKDLILGVNRLMTNHTYTSNVVLCPPFIYLKFANETFHHNKVKVGSQNVSQYNNGAYTGEISAELLKSLETEFAIIGHSERRQYFNETNEIVFEKVQRCLEHSITPIVCVGETLDERKSMQHFTVIQQQLSKLFSLSAEDFQKIVIAYEPVWAIGTGETASPTQAQEVHEFIRKEIASKYGNEVAETISILYGGSVKSANAADLFSQKDIDGGLIGGASLDLNEFSAIINALDKAI